MWDVTHLNMRHAQKESDRANGEVIEFATRLIHICDMTHPYAGRDSFKYGTRLERRRLHEWSGGVVHMCAVTRSHV